VKLEKAKAFLQSKIYGKNTTLGQIWIINFMSKMCFFVCFVLLIYKEVSTVQKKMQKKRREIRKYLVYSYKSNAKS